MRFTQKIQTDKEVWLDVKDKKILYYLSQNARMPYTQLAKKVALSKDTIKYRINNLEKKGVIQGYIAFIDINKLGYATYHLFLQLYSLNKESRKKLIGTLCSYPFVKAVIEFSGKFDIELSLVAKNIEELDHIMTQVINDASPYLQDHILLLISKPYVSKLFPTSLIKINDRLKKETKSKNTIIKIDKRDMELLKLLSTDAVLPLYKLGDKVGLSADAVNYRIKRLIEQKIIIKFFPVLNYSIIGYTIYTVLMNIHNLTMEKEKTLNYFLKTNKRVLWAVKAIGRYNLLMYICVKKSSKLHETLIKFRELFPSEIRRYETLIAYEEYKYTYFPESLALLTF